MHKMAENCRFSLAHKNLNTMKGTKMRTDEDESDDWLLKRPQKAVMEGATKQK